MVLRKRGKGMVLQLNQQESRAFFETIDSELKSVVNEYDSNTGRRPGQKRIEDGKYAKSIIEKWIQTQNMIPGTPYVNLDVINACKLDLTSSEVTYSRNLLQKDIKRYQKELAQFSKPYKGVLLAMYESMSVMQQLVVRLKSR